MVNRIISSQVTTHTDGIVTLRHNLSKLDIFSDEGLAAAIEQHPEDLLDVTVQGSFKTCNRNGFSAQQLIEAVKAGKFWVNLRQIETIDSPIGRLVAQLHAEADQRLGLKTRSQIGGLLISSPSARVGYHFDLTEVRLCHLRGRKRIYIYPPESPYLDPENIQDIAMALGVEKLPYEAGYDQGAHVFDLEPGDIITWPHHAPHRVDNLEGLNVSLSLEALSTESRLRNGAHFLDGFLRTRFDAKLLPQNTNPLVQVIKTALAIALKKSGTVKEQHSAEVFHFDLDENAPDYIRELPQAAE